MDGKSDRDLFEDIGTDPMVAINAARKLAEDSAHDPERVGITPSSERSQRAKQSRAKGDYVEDHCVRTLTQEGWLAVKVDYTSGGGPYRAVTQHDMFGIADVLAIRNGVVKLVQVTMDTAENRNSHERTFCEDRKKFIEKRTQRTPYENLSQWLGHGGLMELWLYRKESERWVARIVPITLEWLEARKAKLDLRRAA